MVLWVVDESWFTATVHVACGWISAGRMTNTDGCRRTKIKTKIGGWMDGAMDALIDGWIA